MKIQADEVVGEVLARDYRTASVFDAYGIDFCCKGDRRIAEAQKR